MKKTLSRLMVTAAAAMGFVLGASPGQDAGASQILYYVDAVAGTDAMAGALTELSGTHTTTYATSMSDFATKIATNDYDLGILAQQGSGGGDYDAAFAALNTFVSGGGRAIVADWTSNDAHLANFDATFTGDLNSTTMSINDPSLAFGMSNPALLMNPGWGIFSTGLNGPAAAVFTSGDASGQASIVIGNGGRTIVNGFLTDTFDDASQGQQLFVNEINYVFGTGVVPEPASMAMMAMGFATVAGLSLRARRASGRS